MSTDLLCQSPVAVVPEEVAASVSTSPEDGSGVFSRYTFSWVYPTLRLAAARGHLEQKDLPALPAADDPAGVFARSSTDIASGCPRGLLFTLTWTAQRALTLTSFIHGWVFLFCMTIDPLLLHALLDDTKKGADPVQGLLLVGALTLSLLCRVACQEISWHTSVRLMNNARSATIHAVFRQALLGHTAANREQDQDAGTLTNYMATDADKLGKSEGLTFFAAQWTWALLSLPFIAFFLAQLVGWAACGSAILVIIGGSFINRKLAVYTKTRTAQVQSVRDERARLMNEVLRGIRTVKLEVWEEIWFRRITDVRKREMRLLVLVRCFNAGNGFVGSLLSLAVPITIFAWYVLVEDRILDYATAFSTLAWISVLQWSLSTLPGAYAMYANLKPSLNRLSTFLVTCSGSGLPSSHSSLVEATALASCRQDEPTGAIDYQPVKLPNHPAILARSLQLGYHEQHPGVGDATRTEDRPIVTVLSFVNLEVHRGELCLVAGPIGCGKSTLLATLAGARSPLSGVCQVNGSCAYASQKPFLLNASVRENIIFTQPFDLDRYQDAVRRAALEADFTALAQGDATPVGEQGVQLSGGQKSRVALARALYSMADVIVCDDVLSAVDAHTAKHLWDEALIGGLTSRGCTVILATHQIQYLSRPEVSRVIILKSGTIALASPWDELPAESKDELLQLVGTWETQGVDCETENEAANFKPPKQEALEEQLEVSLGLEEAAEAVAGVLRNFEGRRVSADLVDEIISSLRGRREEEVRQGTITAADFYVYLSSFGSPVLVALLLTAACIVGFLSIMTNVWLSIWTSGTATLSEQRQGLYVNLAIALLSSTFGAMQNILLTLCALRASRTIHDEMLKRVFEAPHSFFDQTATGRVLNRFLQDLDSVDTFVPDCLLGQLTRTLNIVSQLGLIFVEAPWILMALPILAVPYTFIFRRVRMPNRDTRRIEAVAHSPVYGHFGDTIAGRETIRAYGVQSAFVRKNLELVNSMALSKYGNSAVCKWAQALSTQWACALFLTCGIACVFLSVQGKMSGGSVGLVLLYSAGLNRAMMDYLMGATTLETQFVSVERVARYMRLCGEVSTQLPSDSAMESRGIAWPAEGAISIRGVCLRYAPHLLPALRGVSLEIPPRKKVALCGRTGSGKSTIFGVLTRLYPMSAGKVELDGKDITGIPLGTLRRVVRTVAQDAFLFSGSILDNLLPRHKEIQSEVEGVCWAVLKMVCMAERIKAAGGLINCRIENGGQNFSVGERQLLTLARALTPLEPDNGLRPPRILLCDEPTASVDLENDRKVHNVLLSLDATVLMICHRLQYIDRFDLVYVLDAGFVCEAGSPIELLAVGQGAASSRLSSLCSEAGVLDDLQRNCI